jgi:hypothetical protein
VIWRGSGAGGKPVIPELLPSPPQLPWSHWWVFVALVVPLGALLFANHRMNASSTSTGGDGKVVGIVGRMGSGKSYMAVRMALGRLKRGANVVTNFSMDLADADRVNACWKATRRVGWGSRLRRVSKEVDLPRRRVRALLGVRGSWRMFRGWEQFAELEDAVVIIDECHLYAPSNKTVVFPDVARFKLSQARKFRLDVYWCSQHENRVNSVLKDLTNMIYICNSWYSGWWFSAKGYEPEKMRRKNQHLDRKGYRFDLGVAELYDTLEVLAADDHLVVGAMVRAHELADAHNRELKQRCEHEKRAHEKAGRCMRKVCVAARLALVAERERDRLGVIAELVAEVDGVERGEAAGS